MAVAVAVAVVAWDWAVPVRYRRKSELALTALPMDPARGECCHHPQPTGEVTKGHSIAAKQVVDKTWKHRSCDITAESLET